MNLFNKFQSIFIQELDQEIEYLKNKQPENLYKPVVYTLNMGGKRIRPVLLLMAHNLYSDNYEEALPIAIAVEMFHNFTLLHDDIMDNADLRRNYQTVHLKYSNEAAILSGDAMSIQSFEYIKQASASSFKEVFALFTTTALQICEGQQFDMDFENRSDVTVEEYLKMIGLKTAVLLAASLKLGAIIANAPSIEAELLYNFGYNLGMAFQLQDDLLDTFGDTASFGKNIGGDIVANKKTFLLLKALEMAKGDTLKELQNLINAKGINREEKIKRVKNIYSSLGVLELSQNKMEDYYQQALACINEIRVEEFKKAELVSLANQLMKRNN